MYIKYPHDDKPLKDLSRLLLVIEREAKRCTGNDHNFISLVFISSYIFSNALKIDSKLFSDVLSDLTSKYAKNMVCIIRTTGPSTLRGFTSHRVFIDSIRDKCYIIEYDYNGQFLNHAKFLVWHHICLTERIIHVSKMYGSTNFTIPGMSNKSYVRVRGRLIRRNVGNYEEYYYSGRQRYTIVNLPQQVAMAIHWYLSEMLKLLIHEVRLYTDPDYLRNILKEHLGRLHTIMNLIDERLRGTTLGELYEAYLEALIEYSRSITLLDQLPGKKLTSKIIEELLKIKEPVLPLLLETMIPSNLEASEEIVKTIGYTEKELREKLRSLLYTLKETREKIESEYYKRIHEITANKLESFIEENADDRERNLYERIKTYGMKHQRKIEEIVKLLEFK